MCDRVRSRRIEILTLGALDVIFADGSETRLDHDSGTEEEGDRERLQCVRECSCVRRCSKQRTNRQQTMDKKRVLMCHLVVLLDAILESLQTISIQKPQGSDVYVSNDTK